MSYLRPASESELSTLLANGHLADLLAAAIRRSGLTLERLSSRLAERGHRVSVTTLSNWQRGTTGPLRTRSLAALSVLDELLDLPDGSLATAAGRVTVPERDAASLVPAASALQRLKERVGLDRLGGYDTLSLHESHTIGPDGTPVRHETRQVIRALRPGLDAYFYFFLTRDGLEPDEIGATVTALSGCRADEPLLEPPDIGCVPLLFEPLAAGETHLFEYATHLAYDRPAAPELRRALSRPLEQMLLRVSFHPDRLPAEVSACVWDVPTAPPVSQTPLRLDADGTAHHLLQAPQPGIYGLSWTF
ncbi:hypothetical protein [Nocardioides sp.]|uniref:hypothetical protein n=1 Tax=Nocardioides sp. TaxID=35761 RepID=UPI0039E5FD11